jgi:SNF2 family DNA or RNA helicase
MSKKIEEKDRLRGPFWDEPVSVITTEEIGDGIKVYAVGEESRENYTQILSPNQIENQLDVEKETETKGYTGDSKRFQQAVEAARIELASEYDTNYALNSSQVDPVPHQLEAVYQYMLPQNFPDNRIKFFLADDAGAGKTIMAGLLIKELRQRGIVEDCLILSPAKLQRQWQSELLRLFDEEFRIVGREDINRAVGEPWEEFNFCITSMSFAIQDDIKKSLRDVQWDLVVVDEAHHLSAYRYGAGDEEERTERYKLGELLRKNSIHRLFLSATPHKGRRDHFQLLLRLLDEDLFAEDQLPREIVHSDEPGTVFLRRMKEDMVDLEGDNIFKDRNVHTVNYNIEGEELDFYEAVTEYVQNQFQSAWKKENRNVQFALIILQRRVASSITAAKKSLERRREGLKELLEDIDRLRKQDFDAPDTETLEELAERQRWELEEEAIRKLTMSTNRDQLEDEIKTLDRLIRKANRIQNKGEEKKLKELKRLLQDEREGTEFFENEKIVIFTEAKDTLSQLTSTLDRWGYSYVTIQGGMNMGHAKDPAKGTRLWAEREFNDPDGPQILVATDAAGEGINLHKECRLMINYDIPWNPTRLEQRMGRIHRYGQDEEVHIYNLVASNTREGYVLETLSMKLEQMKEDIGSDRVFDVISELSEDVRLDELIQDVVSGTSTQQDVESRLQDLDEQGKRAVERAEQEGLATRHIDLHQVRQMLRENREKRLTPEYVEKFFVNSFKLLEGTIDKRQDGFWRIEWVPADIRRVTDGTEIREPETEYTKFTLHKERARDDDSVEFVAPGHPLFEAVAIKAREEFSVDLNEGAAFVDPDASESYLLWFIRQSFEDGNRDTVREDIFCVKYDEEDGYRRVNEAILHDLASFDGDDETEPTSQLDIDEEEVSSWYYDNVAKEEQTEVEQERKEVVETIRPSMKKALNSAIVDLRNEIKGLEKRSEEGEDMEISIGNKKRKKEKLVERRDRQTDRLEQAENVVPVEPVIIGSAIVFPSDEEEGGDGMARDDEVEEIAMGVTFDYERDRGRSPEDVSQENLGFDIRSLRLGDDDEVEEARYIEVKGRSGEGSIALTENEWTMASRLGEEFWLYIVTNTKSEPELHTIQDPASKLDPREHTVVRYFVGQEEWDTEVEGGN